MVIQLKAPREMLEVLIRRGKKNGGRKDILAKRSPDEIPRADDFIDLFLVYASLQPDEELKNILIDPFWKKLENICLDERSEIRSFFKHMHRFWREKGSRPLFKQYSYMLGFSNFDNLDELFNTSAGPWARHYRKYLDFTLFPALNQKEYQGFIGKMLDLTEEVWNRIKQEVDSHEQELPGITSLE